MVEEQCLNNFKITHGFSIVEGKNPEVTHDATVRLWKCFLDLRSQARWMLLRIWENRQAPIPPVPKATTYLGFSGQFSFPRPTARPVQRGKRNQGWGRRRLPRVWDYPVLPSRCPARQPRRNAQAGGCACRSHLRNTRARRIIPGCRAGFAGRAAGSCE